jgi:hypothetical protein
LEVESSGDGIYIQHFAGKVQAGVCLAFQGGKIYVAKRNASASYKFFAEFAFAREGIAVGGENGGEAVEPLASYLGPADVFSEAGFSEQVAPQPALQQMGSGNLLLRVLCGGFL